MSELECRNIVLGQQVGDSEMDSSQEKFKTSIESYVKKFGKLLECCIYVEDILRTDIRPRNKERPLNNLFWRQGAMNGVFIFFLRLLMSEEHKISGLVFNKVEKEGGGGDQPVDVQNYIEAAVAVLDDLGYHIPLPSDDDT